ncbi:MAG: TlpA disulfide reductase family protein [Myxococcota bacterium]|nr:TlpA disulfide reductase family protein [Myxococcota bacterium]
MSEVEDEPTPPLPWAQLLVLSAGLMAVSFGATLPLFRRGWQAPGQSILNQWLTGLLPEFILLFGFGLSLQLWRRWRQGTAVKWAQAAADGIGFWQGAALVVAVSAAVYHGLLTAFYLGHLGQYPGWIEALPYQGVGPLLRQSPGGAQLLAWGILLTGAILGGLLERKARWRQGLLWIGLILLLGSGVYPAYRQASTRQIIASGDQVAARLQPIRRLDGGTFSPDQLADHLTLVEFFTTWCGSCKRLLPRLKALDEAITDPRFRVVLISRDAADGRGAVLTKLKKYQQRYRPELEIMVDGRGANSWGGQVGITVYPTLALIDGDGRVRRLWSGTPGKGELEAEVRQALVDHSSL